MYESGKSDSENSKTICSLYVQSGQELDCDVCVFILSDKNSVQPCNK